MDGHRKFRGARGVSKVQVSIGKHEAKLEFPEWKGVGEGWECSNQKTMCGEGMDILWNNTLLSSAWN